MALDYGFCTRKIDEHTKKYVYFGPPVAISKAVVDAVDSGGQIVLTGNAHSELAKFLRSVDPCIPVDLGVHRLAGTDDAVPLITLLPQALKGRWEHFKPLKTLEQIMPGYQDAPGTEKFSITGVSCSDAASPSPFQTAMVFVLPQKLILKKYKQKMVLAYLHKFTTLLRAELRRGGGYECQEDAGAFMLVFSCVPNALYWSCSVLKRLVLQRWEAEGTLQKTGTGMGLLGRQSRRDRSAYSAKIRKARVSSRAPEDRHCLQLLKAIPVDLMLPQIGVHFGTPTQVCPHGSTGRADYFGPLVNKSARIAAKAGVGEAFISEEAVTAFLREKDVDGTGMVTQLDMELLAGALVDRGMFTLKGFEGPTRLWSIEKGVHPVRQARSESLTSCDSSDQSVFVLPNSNCLMEPVTEQMEQADEILPGLI